MTAKARDRMLSTKRHLYVTARDVRGILSGELTALLQPLRGPRLIPGAVQRAPDKDKKRWMAFADGSEVLITSGKDLQWYSLVEPVMLDAGNGNPVYEADYPAGGLPIQRFGGAARRVVAQPEAYVRLQVQLAAPRYFPISDISEEQADRLITEEDVDRPSRHQLLPYSAAYHAPYDSAKVIFLWNWANQYGSRTLELNPWVMYTPIVEILFKTKSGTVIRHQSGESYEDYR
jgi:hypothetical protein